MFNIIKIALKFYKGREGERKDAGFNHDRRKCIPKENIFPQNEFITHPGGEIKGTLT